MVDDIDIQQRNREVVEDDDRDGPLLFWVGVKLLFIAAVLWFATPHPPPCTLAGATLSVCRWNR